MERIEYIVHFTYQINDDREKQYYHKFDTLLTKKEYKDDIQAMYDDSLVVVSIDKIEKETTTTEELTIE